MPSITTTIPICAGSPNPYDTDTPRPPWDLHPQRTRETRTGGRRRAASAMPSGRHSNIPKKCRGHEKTTKHHYQVYTHLQPPHKLRQELRTPSRGARRHYVGYGAHLHRQVPRGACWGGSGGEATMGRHPKQGDARSGGRPREDTYERNSSEGGPPASLCDLQDNVPNEVPVAERTGGGRNNQRNPTRNIGGAPRRHEVGKVQDGHTTGRRPRTGTYGRRSTHRCRACTTHTQPDSRPEARTMEELLQIPTPPALWDTGGGCNAHKQL